MMIQRQQKYDHLMYHFVTNSTFGSFGICLMKLLRMKLFSEYCYKNPALFPDSLTQSNNLYFIQIISRLSMNPYIIKFTNNVCSYLSHYG